MEAVVAIIQDKLHWKRTTICLLVVVACVALAVPSSLGYGIWSGVKILGLSILDFFDFVSNSVIMPIVAIATCVLVGWFVGTKTIEDEVCVNGEKFKRKHIFRVMVKYVAPVFLLVILVFYSLAQFGIIDF